MQFTLKLPVETSGSVLMTENVLLCFVAVMCQNSVEKDLNDLFCDIRKITPTFINFVSMKEGRICCGYTVVVFTFCFRYIRNYCFFVSYFFF